MFVVVCGLLHYPSRLGFDTNTVRFDGNCERRKDGVSLRVRKKRETLVDRQLRKIPPKYRIIWMVPQRAISMKVSWKTTILALFSMRGWTVGQTSVSPRQLLAGM